MYFIVILLHLAFALLNYFIQYGYDKTTKRKSYIFNKIDSAKEVLEFLKHLSRLFPYRHWYLISRWCFCTICLNRPMRAVRGCCITLWNIYLLVQLPGLVEIASSTQSCSIYAAREIVQLFINIETLGFKCQIG